MSCKWILLLISAMVFSQSKTIAFHFKPLCQNNDLLPKQAFYSGSQNDSIRIFVFRFYISNVVFLSKSKPVYETQDTYFLMDFTDTVSLKRQLQIPKDCNFDEIRFLLGIDTKTNDAGIGADELDPVKGMYWAWQSGYINMKLEGERIKDHKTFEFHLGGFLEPFLSCRSISVRPQSQDDITVYVDVAALLNGISLDEIHAVMSPGEKSMMLSDKAVSMFRL